MLPSIESLIPNPPSPSHVTLHSYCRQVLRSSWSPTGRTRCWRCRGSSRRPFGAGNGNDRRGDQPQAADELARPANRSRSKDFSARRLGTAKTRRFSRATEPSCCCREYDNLGDGRVKIHPCTIVFPYEGPAENEAQRRRQTVILEAPDGRRAPVRPAAGPRPGEGRTAGGRATQGQGHDPQRLEAAGPRGRPADHHPRHSAHRADDLHAQSGRVPLGAAFRPRPRHGHQAAGRRRPKRTIRSAARTWPASSRSRFATSSGCTSIWARRRKRRAKRGQASDAGGNPLPRPLPLRRGPSRGDFPRRRGRDEAEPVRPLRPDRLRIAFVVLPRIAEERLGRPAAGDGKMPAPPARSIWWPSGSRPAAIPSW